VPFLLAGHVGAVGLITALAISASVVDSSPFSTSGPGGGERTGGPPGVRLPPADGLGFSMVVVAPPITWLLLVVPGGWGDDS